MRTNYASSSLWEAAVGYSRAVRIGNLIEVAGTTASDGDGNIYGKTVYEQAMYIFDKQQKALEELGASMQDVIRTRMYVTNIETWDEAGKAHAEFFKDIKPVATLVEVKGLVSPELLIEIELTAYID